jgi:hypothetical protein
MPVHGGHGRPPLHIKLQYLEHHLKWSHASLHGGHGRPPLHIKLQYLEHLW